MKRFIILLTFLNAYSSGAQTASPQTNAINNLVLPEDYITSPYGSVPHYEKSGKGKQTLIIIPGLGFDETVFDDFLNKTKKEYTSYVITIPGYGKTQAPPMPAAGVSYGDQYWNKGIIQGLLTLMEKEKLVRPVIVGHFVQGTQLALRMAIDYPDKVGGVIVLGGPGKFIVIQQGEPKEYPLKNTISYIDKVTAPQWFGPISKKDFDAGNYLPEVYSLQPVVGDALWKQSAAVPISVVVRYLCEFFASDITLEFDKIICPVLLLRAGFNDELLKKDVNNYIVPQFVSSWNKAIGTNKGFTIKDIPNSSVFVWKDNPQQTFKEIQVFLQTIGPSTQNK